MKLFVVAAIIAVSGAARLEHLEQQQRLRAYLPPHQGGNGHSSFGAIPGAYGTAGSGQPNLNAVAAFPSASNQYLPPDHGPSASTGSNGFAGSINGFGAQNTQFGQQPIPVQRFGQQSQLGQLDATQQGSLLQQPGVNQQYGHSSDNVPQQAFDAQTGYHY